MSLCFIKSSNHVKIIAKSVQASALPLVALAKCGTTLEPFTLRVYQYLVDESAHKY